MSNLPGDDSRKLALRVIELAHEKKARDMVMIEVGKISIVADFFIIITGATRVQVHTICDRIMSGLKEAGWKLYRMEGYREGWWVVLDYGLLVIHVMQPEARTFYDLERIWSKAPVLSATPGEAPGESVGDVYPGSE